MGESLNNQVLAGCLLQTACNAEKWRFLSKKAIFLLAGCLLFLGGGAIDILTKMVYICAVWRSRGKFRASCNRIMQVAC